MNPRILIATRKGLFTLERNDGAVPWQISRADFLGDNCTLAMHDARDGTAYAALNHGHFGIKLHRSNDGGRSWQECSVPSYPPPPVGEEPVQCPMRKIPIPNNLELIWALEPGGKNEPGVLWCGTAPGGLFRSSDRGTTWELMESLWRRPERRAWFGGGLDYPAIHSICVDPRDARHVAIGISCGGVWVTTDGGLTWACRADGMRAAYMPPEKASDPNTQDPHRVVLCPAQPDVWWTQHHNGIFRTTDAGQRWHEIPTAGPSTFGFAVAVHPRDQQTAWFVPGTSDERRIPPSGQVVVTRTRDGGRNFDVLRRGLPQEHAYDIVFRHALDIDATGDVLCMGSSTGSVWVSEDQGDSWQCITAHLPPVHAVRFSQ